MKINLREKTMLKPIEKTAHQIIWTSYLDQLFSFFNPFIYFYRPNGSRDFFCADVLKHALSKVLVSFFPYAGRFNMNEQGRIEIDCNDEGALFIEAETDSVLDVLGDFAPSNEIKWLIPDVDTTKGICSFPLLSVQVTHFKCGGVSLGVLVAHIVCDGAAYNHCINSWARIARGLDVEISPLIGRSLLRSRDPPMPSFPHIELQPAPTMKQPVNPFNFDVAMFKFSSQQVRQLKAQCIGAHDIVSSFKVIAAHVWRCVCKARGLEDDQESRMGFIVDIRSRLVPPVPWEYFGNAVFTITTTSTAGEIRSKPLVDTVRSIHGDLQRADDEYLRSVIDYLEVHSGNFNVMCSPNLFFISLCQIPVYDADFGWGKPIFNGLGFLLYEGLVYLLQSPTMDGSFNLVISLQPDHMVLFRKYVQDI